MEKNDFPTGLISISWYHVHVHDFDDAGLTGTTEQELLFFTLGDTKDGECSLGAYQELHFALHVRSGLQGRLGFENVEGNWIISTRSVRSLPSRLR